MYTILVLGLALGVAVADVGLGYHYDLPPTSYGLPSYQIGSSSSVPSSNNAFSIVSTGYPTAGANLYSTSNNNYEYSQTSAASSSRPSLTGTLGVDSGLNYNVLGSLSGSGLSSNYNTGSSGLNYNSGVTGGSDYSSNYNTLNSGGVSSGTGLNSNYNTINSGASIGSGYDTSYNTAESSNYNNAGSSSYNTPGSGSLSSSNFNVGGDSGSSLNTGSNYNYAQGNLGSGISYVPNYLTVPSVTVDTSTLDKIGSYYQSASANNQFISNNYGSGNALQQEYVNVVQSNQPSQVFKHYYVHAAPEEPEISKPRGPIVLPPPQKHYKIIFIKAPVQPQPAPQIITVPQQNEEKTIVYVLVKKPEDAKNIVIPKFDQKAPSKPEVFFIKYNNPHDSQKLIDNIVGDYNKGGISASFSGAGISGLTSKSGTEDSSSNGSTSSSLVSAGSESDLTSTIQSIFGSDTIAQPEGSLSLDSGTSAGASSTVAPETYVSDTNGPTSSSSFSSEFSSSDLGSTGFGSNIGGSTVSNTGSIEIGAKPTTSYSLSGSENSGSSSGSSAVISKPSVSFGANRFGSTGFSFNTIGSKPSVSFGTDYKNKGSNFGSSYVTKPSYVSSVSNVGSGSSGLLGSGSLSGPSSTTFGSSYSIGSQSSSDSASSFDLGSLSADSNRFGSESSNSGSTLSSGFETNYNQANAVSTSQGVPHLTYGVPTFRA